MEISRSSKSVTLAINIARVLATADPLEGVSISVEARQVLRELAIG